MAAAGVAAFSPDQIAGLQLWLKADAITGLSDGSAITTWTDSSGSGRDATTNLGTPVFKSGVLNGMPVVRFPSSGDEQSMLLGSPFLVDDSTIIVCHAKASGASNVNVLAYGGSYQYLHYGSLWYLVNSSISSVMASGAFYIMTAVSVDSPRTVVRWSNGNNLGQTTSDRPFGFSMIGLPGSPGPQGDIAEIIVYDSALSDANRQAVEAYLSAKYGIALA